MDIQEIVFELNIEYAIILSNFVRNTLPFPLQYSYTI